MKACKNCGKKFKPFKTTQVVCSWQCSIEYAKKQAEEKERTWPERKKKMQEGLKTRTQKINEARKIFQEYIRERDKDKPCISCGTTTAKKWDAGHYYKAEVYTGLIFNEDNVHKQCQRCNQYGGGMQAEYREGLIKRIGQDAVNTLESTKDDLRVYRWTDEELEEIKKTSKKMLKSLRVKK